MKPQYTMILLSYKAYSAWRPSDGSSVDSAACTQSIPSLYNFRGWDLQASCRGFEAVEDAGGFHGS